MQIYSFQWENTWSKSTAKTLAQAPGDLPVENVKRSDQHQVNEAVPSIMAQSWRWGQPKGSYKKILHRSCYFAFIVDFIVHSEIS